MRRKYEIMIFGSLFVLVLDQLTKLAVLTRFRNRQSVNLIDNLLSFTFVGNDGAAFGLFSGFHINFFLIVSVFAIGFILYFFWTIEPERNLLVSALALIMGGALGNMLDRFRLGFVVDFIDVHHKFTVVPFNFVWPKFNVADMAILVGVGLFMIDMFRFERMKAAMEKEDEGVA